MFAVRIVQEAQRIVFPITGLSLLLPAIVPSWRFFDAVTASPRVDYALLRGSDAAADTWREFRPRAAVLTPGMMLRRLFWNATWNENLFLASLAERLLQASTPETVAHSERELLLRIARHLEREGCDPQTWLQVRVRIVNRTGMGEQTDSQTVWSSTPCLLAGLLRP